MFRWNHKFVPMETSSSLHWNENITPGMQVGTTQKLYVLLEPQLSNSDT